MKDITFDKPAAEKEAPYSAPKETPAIRETISRLCAKKKESLTSIEFLRLVSSHLKCSFKDAYFLTEFLYLEKSKE